MTTTSTANCNSVDTQPLTRNHSRARAPPRIVEISHHSQANISICPPLRRGARSGLVGLFWSSRFAALAMLGADFDSLDALEKALNGVGGAVRYCRDARPCGR